MDEQTKKSNQVVTVLFDNVPVCVVTTRPVTDNSDDVDLYYESTDILAAVHTALLSAANAISFMVWKETGVLPSPTDYDPPDVIEPFPF